MFSTTFGQNSGFFCYLATVCPTMPSCHCDMCHLYLVRSSKSGASAISVTSSARQLPHAGPPADLLAATLATPYPCTQSPSPAVAASFALQMPPAGPPVNLLAATLATLLCTRLSLPAPTPKFCLLVASSWPSGDSALQTHQRHCGLTLVATLLVTALSGAALPQVCLATRHLRYHYRMFVTTMSGFGTNARFCRPPCSWLALWGCRGGYLLSSLAASSSFCGTSFLPGTSW